MNTDPKISDLERVHGVTWGKLTGLEPQLDELLWQARAAAAGCQDRKDVQRVFAPFRDAVSELVGLRGRHRNCPILGSVEAYEVAYWRLYEAVNDLLPRPAVSAAIASAGGMSERCLAGGHEYQEVKASDPCAWVAGVKTLPTTCEREAVSGRHAAPQGFTSLALWGRRLKSWRRLFTVMGSVGRD